MSNICQKIWMCKVQYRYIYVYIYIYIYIYMTIATEALNPMMFIGIELTEYFGCRWHWQKIDLTISMSLYKVIWKICLPIFAPGPFISLRDVTVSCLCSSLNKISALLSLSLYPYLYTYIDMHMNYGLCCNVHTCISKSHPYVYFCILAVANIIPYQLCTLF